MKKHRYVSFVDGKGNKQKGIVIDTIKLEKWKKYPNINIVVIPSHGATPILKWINDIYCTDTDKINLSKIKKEHLNKDNWDIVDCVYLKNKKRK